MTKEKAFISMPTLPAWREPPAENQQWRLISRVGLVFHSQPNESHPHPSHPWHFSHTSHCDWNSFYSSVFCESLYVCLLCRNKQVKHCDVNGSGGFFSQCDVTTSTPLPVQGAAITFLKKIPLFWRRPSYKGSVFSVSKLLLGFNSAQTFLRTLQGERTRASETSEQTGLFFFFSLRTH